MTTFRAAARQYFTTVFAAHARTETMLIGASSFRRLISENIQYLDLEGKGKLILANRQA